MDKNDLDMDEDTHIVCEECDGEKGYWASPDANGGINECMHDTWEDCPVCDGEGYYGKLKGKVVAIDFDGVISAYDGWKGIDDLGCDSLGADTIIQELIDRGAEVWVYSCRLSEDLNKGHTIQELRKKLADWLNFNKYPVELQIWDMPGKPIADLYIDDRAYHHTTNATWYPDEIETVIKRLEGQ